MTINQTSAFETTRALRCPTPSNTISSSTADMVGVSSMDNANNAASFAAKMKEFQASDEARQKLFAVCNHCLGFLPHMAVLATNGDHRTCFNNTMIY